MCRYGGNFFVGFEGSFGGQHVTPRGLSARMLGKMVCVEGIVSKCGLIHPKVVKSVHYCPETTQSLGTFQNGCFCELGIPRSRRASPELTLHNGLY